MTAVVRCRTCNRPLTRGDSRMRERGLICHNRAELIAALAGRNRTRGRVNRHGHDNHKEK